jgi:hypothetical protein
MSRYNEKANAQDLQNSRQVWQSAAVLLVLAIVATCLKAGLVGCDAVRPAHAVSVDATESDSEKSPLVSRPTDPREALHHAVEFLWSKQAADGGWHSETYALLKSGQALTPFVLHALLAVPEDVYPRPADGVDRALQFLRDNTNSEGALGLRDPEILEYPNYSTSYALRCLVAVGDSEDRPRIQRMRNYLVAEQFTESRGFAPDSPAYGGWGFGGTYPPGQTGHMDLAHTRRVLEALQETGLDCLDSKQKAERFLHFVQRHPDDGRPQPDPLGTAIPDNLSTPYDGGFYFSPVVLAANKGRSEPLGEDSAACFRSYATATCDGLLALHAAGVPDHDERVQAALEWLGRNPRLEYPDGIPEDHPEPWGKAVYFYHLAVRSEIGSKFSLSGQWSHAIGQLLLKEQQSDGSFVNRRSPLMKEDDPIMCTALGVIALTRCQSAEE